MKVYRDNVIEYLFGSHDFQQGRVKSRANRAAVVSYFLHYPNQYLGFKKTRNVINNSSIGEDEKTIILRRLDNAKLIWSQEIDDFFSHYSVFQDTVQPTPVEVELDEDLMDDDLPTGHQNIFEMEKMQYKTFSKILYQKWRSHPSISGLSAADQATKFWVDYQKQFPTLSKIAKIVNRVSPTSSDIERYFSELNYDMHSRRNRMLPSTILRRSICKYADEFIKATQNIPTADDDDSL